MLVGCVLIYWHIYICVIFILISLCLVYFAYLFASYHDMLFLMLLY